MFKNAALPDLSFLCVNGDVWLNPLTYMLNVNPVIPSPTLVALSLTRERREA
jgi:hypothetical protein